MEQDKIRIIAKSISKKENDYSLSYLSGGIEFVPKYHNGINFIIKDKKIYKRGSDNNFVEIRLRDMQSELRIINQEDVNEAVDNFDGNYDKFIKDLKDTGKFHVKVIKSASEEKESLGYGGGGGGGSNSHGGLGDYKSLRDKIMEDVVSDVKKSSIFKPGDKVINMEVGIGREKEAIVVDKKEIKMDEKGIPKNIPGAYKQIDWSKNIPIKYVHNNQYDYVPKHLLKKA